MPVEFIIHGKDKCEQIIQNSRKLHYLHSHWHCFGPALVAARRSSDPVLCSPRLATQRDRKFSQHRQPQELSKKYFFCLRLTTCANLNNLPKYSNTFCGWGCSMRCPNAEDGGIGSAATYVDCCHVEVVICCFG